MAVEGDMIYEEVLQHSLCGLFHDRNFARREELEWKSGLAVAHLAQAGLRWGSIISARVDLSRAEPVLIELVPQPYPRRSSDSLSQEAEKLLGLFPTHQWGDAFAFAAGQLPRGW